MTAPAPQSRRSGLPAGSGWLLLVAAEWGRLVLEQSTWTAYSRIERIATEQLGMKVPEPSDVILVQP